MALNFPGTGESADAAGAHSLGSGQEEMSILVCVYFFTLSPLVNCTLEYKVASVFIPLACG